MSLNQPSPPLAWVPEACTLPTADQPVRLAEFDELFGAAVCVRRIDASRLELELRPEPTVAARAAELSARETACCSFFTFGLTISAGALTLEVRTSATHVDVLDALSTRAAALAVGAA